MLPNDVVGIAINEDVSLVAAWRKHLGKTQTEVAKAMGVSQSAYAQMEAARKPRKVTLQKIAAALGVSVDQLSE